MPKHFEVSKPKQFEVSKQTYRICFCCRRRFKLAAAEAPKEIKALFGKYSENGVMTASYLQQFMVEEQKEESVTIRDAQGIIDGLRHLHVFHHRGINLEGFFKYLFGDTNPPLPPKHEVHQDMDAPLSHYFIYTGHNSYLTGNQLTSPSSDAPIINALQRSVRVIELDVWPNSSKDNVDVLHGGTMTAPVELIKCLRAIKKYAFSASDYPAVITLEDHLTTSLQAKAAEMITQTLGETLYIPESKCIKEFPSPNLLKKRVMISTKPPEDVEGKDMAQKSNKESTDNEKETMKTQKAPEYKRLIAIHAGKPKGGLKEALAIDPNKVRRLSLSEPELEKVADDYGKELVRFTQNNILRVYPKGTRIDSSNYDPLLAWTHGAQMVAFNMQGHGKPLWLMQGMFRANGGCGYVKKPDFLLNSTGPDNESFCPKDKLSVKKILKVNVYMGDGWYYDFHHEHFDQFSPPDFYVKIGIAGVPADTGTKKTKVIEDNWIPSWNEEFEFPLTSPELGLLRIEVHEYDMSNSDDFAGQTCLPIWELREGIRCVPLYNYEGEMYKSVKLLMCFRFVSP